MIKFLILIIFIYMKPSLFAQAGGETIIGLDNAQYKKKGVITNPQPTVEINKPPAKKTKDVKIETETPEKVTLVSELFCDWKKNSRTSLISGENCNRKNQSICTGFITCEKSINGQKVKFNRLATCSEKACAIGAEACHKEKIGYYSKLFLNTESNSKLDDKNTEPSSNSKR